MGRIRCSSVSRGTHKPRTGAKLEVSVQDFKEMFRRLFPQTRGSSTVPSATVIALAEQVWSWVKESRTLTREIAWKDIVEWFAADQPENAHSGVALRRGTAEGVEVVLLMVDAEQKPVRRADGAVAGVILCAARLDEETEQAFHGKNLIVFN
jgi:hypothetical protein